LFTQTSPRDWFAAGPALLILGDMSVQGAIKPLRSLVGPLRLGMGNGAKPALIPIENKRNFLDVPADIMEHVDPQGARTLTPGLPKCYFAGAGNAGSLPMSRMSC